MEKKELVVYLKCKYCGEKLNSTKVENYNTQAFDPDISNIHVCDQEKVKEFRREFHNLIREVTKEQSDILKLKDVDENQLNKPFNI